MFTCPFRTRTRGTPSIFEWKAIKGAKTKQPYAIGMQSGEPFALAAIWENWKRPGTQEWVRTFCVITCRANQLVGEIHDRMPVIIPPGRMITGSRRSTLIRVGCWCRFRLQP